MSCVSVAVLRKLTSAPIDRKTAMEVELTISNERVCQLVDRGTLWPHLEEFAKRVKLSGSVSERESFDYLERVLLSYGFTTNLITHPAYISLPEAASLTMEDSEFAAITHSFSLASPSNGLSRPLVYIGRGEPEELAGRRLDGKIVIFEGMARPAAALIASRAGADGIIHISPHDHLHEMCVSPVWGSPDETSLQHIPTVTIVTISKRDGDVIKARLQRNADAQATLRARVDTGWRETPLLEAEITPISASGSEPYVLFSGHHDTWHYGVMDNGGANATMLEVARIMSQHRDELRRTLRLCFWSGHSHGRYTGSAWYADTRRFDLEARCVAHVNVDSTGGRNNKDLSHAPASAELRDLAKEAALVHGNQPISGERLGRAGDQSFWGIGIPSLFMGMGEQDEAEGEETSRSLVGAMGLPSFGWWWHTPEDTLDKMDDEILMRDTRIYLHAIWRLTTDECLPVRVDAQLRDLASHVSSVASDLRARFDLQPILDKIDVLKRQIEIRSLGDQQIMALCRQLVPLDYTSGDRFTHDFALPQKPYPLLDCFRSLAELPDGSKMIPFLQVSCQRAHNRIIDALNRSILLVNSDHISPSN